MLLPITIKTSRYFRINSDRIANSFVKANNQLLEIIHRNGFTGKKIILAPRCLSLKIKKMLVKTGKEHNIKVYINNGGNSARHRVKKENPNLILAIACERELLAGIHDVYKISPVYAIPNTRPYGPCMETEYNNSDLINAMEYFKKK